MQTWGEGVKAAGTTVDLANSDPLMVTLFLLMLRKIYQVTESKLRVLLYCYGNQDIQKLKIFWSSQLHIPMKQFIKPYLRQDYQPNKSHKMPYGVAHIRYNDTKLHWEITQDIAIMSRHLLDICWDGRVDKYTSL